MGTAVVVIDGVQRSSIDRAEQTNHQQGRPLQTRPSLRWRSVQTAVLLKAFDETRSCPR